MATRKSKKGRPTPKPIKTVFDVLFYLTGVWAVVSNAIPNLDEHILYLIGNWSAILIVIMKFTITNFGWDYEPIESKTSDDDKDN